LDRRHRGKNSRRNRNFEFYLHAGFREENKLGEKPNMDRPDADAGISGLMDFWDEWIEENVNDCVTTGIRGPRSSAAIP
jgi:hypothetical protein